MKIQPNFDFWQNEPKFPERGCVVAQPTVCVHEISNSSARRSSRSEKKPRAQSRDMSRQPALIRQLLITPPDRRRLVDDLAHGRGALFRGLQILEDQREGGSAALLLDGEAGAGNEAVAEIEIVHLSDAPDHLIAPSSRARAFA